MRTQKMVSVLYKIIKVKSIVAVKKKKLASLTGNRTPAVRVTGGNPHH